MAALGNDCYFFCTSSCAKGPACPFRHVESAKTCRIICQHWQMGGCLRPMCKFRHSDFAFQLDTSDVPCYWEALPTGCVRTNCMYKHSKPKALDDVASTAAAGSMSVDPSTVGTTASRNEVNTSQTFIQPVVTPVIIQNLAESEESNSSPMKRPPEVTQETQIQAVPKKQETEIQTSENSTVNDDKLSPSTKEQTVNKKTKKVTPVVKKVKKNIAVQKTVKKIVGKNTGKITAKSKKNDYQPRKSVKDRLGKAPSPKPVIQSSSSEDSDSGSSSDSDDSIENIKVKSIEEILRQKALESMMKKRTTERKPSADRRLLSPAGKKSPAQQKFSPPARNFKKPAPTVKRVKHVPAPVESSSSSSEEESSDEKHMPNQSSEKSSTSSSDASSSSSASDSEEDTADSEDLDVRRVVVDLDSEKAARKKAKASFLKKQKLMAASAHGSKNKGHITRVPARKVDHMPLSALNKNNNRGKQQNRRRIDVDYDFDDIVSSRVREPLKLSVQDRLGKSTTLHRSSSDVRLSRTEKFGSAVDLRKPVPKQKSNAPPVTKSKKSSSSSDDDSLAEVKVKTLEEIRLEKIKKQSAEENKRKLTSQARETGSHKPLPVKQRLGKIPAENQNIDVDNMKGRQVVLVNDSGSKSDDASNLKTLDEQKKAKKRPWRSQKRNVDPSSAEAFAGDGERTAVMASPPANVDDYAAELNSYKEEQNVDESPFERLKRKALMKKIQSRMLKQTASADEGNPVEAGSETLKKVAELEHGADTQTHKHKHNHKHHKRVKIERQIYMPPAMKNTPKVPEPSHAPEPASPKRELFTGPTAKVSPQKRGPHPIAAAWSAGLTLSSKGASVRRPEPTLTPAVSSGIVGRLEMGDRLGIKVTAPTKPKEIISSNQTSQPPVESLGVTIKSFSEIMAEKRKRRIEMLAQKSGTADHPTSLVSSSVSSLPSSTTVSLPQTSIEPNFTSSQKVDVRPRVPILPIVFAPDKLSSSTGKATIQADSSSWRVTAQSAASTTQKVSPAVSTFNTPSTNSPLPHSTTTTTDKVKLKSGKNSKNNVDKKKKVKKLFSKKNSTEQQIDLSCSVTSEGSSNKTSSSSLHPYRAASSVSEATASSLETSSHHHRSSKASNDVPSSYHTVSDSKVSASQNAADTGGQGVLAKPSVLKLPTKTDSSPAVKTSPAPTRKHSISAANVDSEPAKKKTNLSIMDDEFNFFEDEDLCVDDGIIPDDIEPIDDLLQDIDDLLS